MKAMGAITIRSRWLETMVLATILLCVTLPSFFETYRIMIFDVMPRDSYEEYLLYFVGHSDGHIKGSPFGYRVISVLLAVPFYYLLPAIKFSLLEPGMDLAHLKAIQALAFTSYLMTAAGAIMIYRILRDRLHANVVTAFATCLLLPLCIGYTAPYGIDPTAIFWIGLCFYFFESLVWFIPLLLLSVIVNDKVFLSFFCLLGARFLLEPRYSLSHYRWQSFTVLAAFCLYVAIVLIVQLPGNIEQTTPTTYWASLQETIIRDLQPRGLILNVLPTFLVLVLYLSAIRFADSAGAYYRRPDILVPLGMFAIAHLFNLDFNVGRVVMHPLPFYLTALGVILVYMQPRSAPGQAQHGE